MRHENQTTQEWQEAKATSGENLNSVRFAWSLLKNHPFQAGSMITLAWLLLLFTIPAPCPPELIQLTGKGLLFWGIIVTGMGLIIAGMFFEKTR